MNRVAEALEKAEIAVAEMKYTTEQAARLEKSLTLQKAQYEAFRDFFRECTKCGQMTQEESTSLFKAFGGSVAVANKKPLHVKVAIHKLSMELVKGRKNDQARRS